MKREAKLQNQLLWDRLQVPSVQPLAPSRVICEIRPGCSELYPAGSWTLQGWRSSPSSLVSWLSSVKFLFLYPAGIYFFNLWFLPLILLPCIITRSPAQLLDTPPARQGQAAVRPSWSCPLPRLRKPLPSLQLCSQDKSSSPDQLGGLH